MIIAADKINPQVAARMVPAFGRWRRFEPKRSAMMKAALERIVATPGLSKDVFEQASKVARVTLDLKWPIFRLIGLALPGPWDDPLIFRLTKATNSMTLSQVQRDAAFDIFVGTDRRRDGRVLLRGNEFDDSYPGLEEAVNSLYDQDPQQKFILDSDLINRLNGRR